MPVKTRRSQKIYPDLSEFKDDKKEIEEDQEDYLTGDEEDFIDHYHFSERKPEFHHQTANLRRRPLHTERLTDEKNSEDSRSDTENFCQKLQEWFESGLEALRHLFTAFIIATLIAIIAFFCAYPVALLKNFNFESYDEVKRSDWDQFLNHVQKLKARMPGQDVDVWTQIRAGLRPLLNRTEILHPSVLFVTGPVEEVNCLCQGVAEATLTAWGNQGKVLDIDSRHFTRQSRTHPDKAGRLISDQIDQYFGKQKRGVLHIRNVDSLSFKTPLILHSLTDHENAKWKEALIILSMEASLENPDNNPSTCYSRISETLNQSWQLVGTDSLAALYARILNSVLCLKEEQDLKC